MEEWGLSYGTKEEYEFRLGIFGQKDEEIKYWNGKQDSFELGHNMFSTMMEFEVKRMSSGLV